MRTVVKFFSLFLVASVLAATPAMAVHWKIYAPDEAGYRYWLDSDTISKGGDGYTYVYWTLGTAGGSEPAQTSAPNLGIKCDTGDSIRLDDKGQWVTGAHFTTAAFLYNAVCPGGTAN